MDDRTLIERAAMAAGYELTWKTGYCKGGEFAGAFIGNVPWRPLDNDGEALRLAVKLRLEIDHNHPLDNDAWSMACENGKMVGFTEPVGDEAQRCAATRRAITRAAASLAQGE